MNRFVPAADATSRLSPYFALGVLSVREALQAAKEVTSAESPSRAKKKKGRRKKRPATTGWRPGCASWVSQLVFREFYRHTLVGSPPDAMDNLKFDFVRWEDDEAGWRKWCEGRTGVPFVDAGMRQLRAEAYMYNQLRKTTSSYLRTNLLVDCRRGERFFAESLVDWDLRNNSQGWAPSLFVLNPAAQAEKYDPRGEYIRKWVPELKNVEGRAVFDPYKRLRKKEFDKLGYPEPHVNFKASAEQYRERYKQAEEMADADP